PGERFVWSIVLVWTACAFVLVYNYAHLMKFVSLASPYEQRAAGASDSALISYLQSYFGVVFSPALIALGLVKSRVRLVMLGLVGCLIIYMISARRTIILLPFAMVALH